MAGVNAPGDVQPDVSFSTIDPEEKSFYVVWTALGACISQVWIPSKTRKE